MVRARRAKPRPARIAVPVVVAVLAIAGAIGVTQNWFGTEGQSTIIPPSASTQAPTRSPSLETRSPTATPSAATGPSTAQALAGCRAKVKAADGVLAAATVGVGHWSEHIQAQTDANSGEISARQMDAIFKRTRLAGADDVSRYQRAVRAHEAAVGSCTPDDGAEASATDRFLSCQQRSKAQQPVIAAAADAMADWQSHLAAMRRSRMGHVHDAQGVWIRAWRAAPPNIKAYQQAIKDYDPPTC